MTASVPIMLLLTLAAAAILYAFWLSIREDLKIHSLADWLESSRGVRWQALPWFRRRLFVVAGIEALRRQGLDQDPDFATRYGGIRHLRRRKAVALLLGAAAIAAVALGTSFWGWVW